MTNSVDLSDPKHSNSSRFFTMDRIIDGDYCITHHVKTYGPGMVVRVWRSFSLVR